MEAQLLILLVSFLALLALNVPVAVVIALCTWTLMLTMPEVPAAYVMAQRMSNGIASFPLLAIPFFILAGLLMGEGGMSRRLIELATLLVGRYRGGLAYVSTLTCMMFGAISGSATAAVSSIGGTMIPAMVRARYSREYAVAVTATAATTGLLIPPSNVMIVYAVVAGNVSVAALFMAGILPGILVGLLIMAACFLQSRVAAEQTADRDERLAPSTESDDLLREGLTRSDLPRTGLLRALFGALPSLLLIVLVLAGILGGAFSATEAAAVAVLYALVMAMLVYREVSYRQLPSLCLRTGLMTSIVFLLISASQAMSWALAYQNIPQTLATMLLQISDHPSVILLTINLALLIVGTFMDMTPAVLIFTPIFLPVVEKLGMHPVHFGVMLVANLCIGLCTPPVGTCLFVGCSVGQTSIARVSRAMVPFFVAMLIALLLITTIPTLSLWLPRWLQLTA